MKTELFGRDKGMRSGNCDVQTVRAAIRSEIFPDMVFFVGGSIQSLSETNLCEDMWA